MAGKMGGMGTKHSLDPKYAYGTAEEISARTKTTHQSEPTNFSQGSQPSTGKNLNEPGMDDPSGYFKFSNPK